MKKVTKHYLQKLYPGYPFSETEGEEVEHRDPKMVEDDGRMIGFRFFDQSFIIDNDEIYTGEEKNFSNWILFGRRLSIEQVKSMYKNDRDKEILIGNMENNDIKYVCFTRSYTFLPMSEGDMTCEEYLEKKDDKPLTLRK